MRPSLLWTETGARNRRQALPCEPQVEPQAFGSHPARAPGRLRLVGAAASERAWVDGVRAIALGSDGLALAWFSGPGGYGTRGTSGPWGWRLERQARTPAPSPTRSAAGHPARARRQTPKIARQTRSKSGTEFRPAARGTPGCAVRLAVRGRGVRAQALPLGRATGRATGRVEAETGRAAEPQTRKTRLSPRKPWQIGASPCAASPAGASLLVAGRPGPQSIVSPGCTSPQAASSTSGTPCPVAEDIRSVGPMTSARAAARSSASGLSHLVATKRRGRVASSGE